MIYYYVMRNYVLDTPHRGGPAVPVLLLFSPFPAIPH